VTCESCLIGAPSGFYCASTEGAVPVDGALTNKGGRAGESIALSLAIRRERPLLETQAVSRALEVEAKLPLDEILVEIGQSEDRPEATRRRGKRPPAEDRELIRAPGDDVLDVVRPIVLVGLRCVRVRLREAHAREPKHVVAVSKTSPGAIANADSIRSAAFGEEMLDGRIARADEGRQETAVEQIADELGLRILVAALVTER